MQQKHQAAVSWMTDPRYPNALQHEDKWHVNADVNLHANTEVPHSRLVTRATYRRQDLVVNERAPTFWQCVSRLDELKKLKPGLSNNADYYSVNC